MSSEAMVKELAREVLKRLAPALGADGRRGRLVVVFSGGTAGLARPWPRPGRSAWRGSSWGSA